MQALLLLLATATTAAAFAPLPRASFVFDFDHVPYADGVRHLHTPEHVATTHRFGAPFFRLHDVEWPMSAGTNRSSIRFTCSTLATRRMRVRMFSSSPAESTLLFFDNDEGRALYKARFVVMPITRTGHRMRLDITLFRGSPLWRAFALAIMPVFVFINGMEDALAFHAPHSASALPQFRMHRRGVLGRDDI